jgi:excisionase family DNA binding protein
VSERLLDAAEVAARLSVPKTWVLESARAGAIPHIRLGRYVRFSWPDVEVWLAECRQPGRPISLRRPVR